MLQSEVQGWRFLRSAKAVVSNAVNYTKLITSKMGIIFTAESWSLSPSWSPRFPAYFLGLSCIPVAGWSENAIAMTYQPNRIFFAWWIWKSTSLARGMRSKFYEYERVHYQKICLSESNTFPRNSKKDFQWLLGQYLILARPRMSILPAFSIIYNSSWRSSAHTTIDCGYRPLLRCKRHLQ